jgi:hypothetical protein
MYQRGWISHWATPITYRILNGTLTCVSSRRAESGRFGQTDALQYHLGLFGSSQPAARG